MLRTEPVVFSPIDPQLLFFAGNTLWQTRDGGELAKDQPGFVATELRVAGECWKISRRCRKEAHRRGVIYTVAPSPLDANRIWCGSDDGLIHLRRPTAGKVGPT